MRVALNGEPRELAEGTTIAGVLGLLGADPQARGVAVALEGEVIPRGEWPATALHDGCRIEVLGAIGGG